MDVFPSEIPPGLPPVRGIEHKIDLIPGRACQTVPLTGPTQRRLRRFSDKSKTFWTAGIFVKALVLVPFLFFWFLRNTVLGAGVLIVETLITSPIDIAILFLGWMTCLMS